MTFRELEIVPPILKALEEKGYKNPTPIQEQAIPIVLQGKDLLGCAQTGTGKTAAFTIPILQQLHNAIGNGSKGKRKIKALIVTPTRELAIQIVDNINEYSQYTGLNSTVIYGGVKQGKQVNRLRQGIDILVATPGRLLDLMGQGFVRLHNLEHFVLDEADQMLDMGFIHDIKKLLKELPQKRQSLFFSATMPKSILELSQQILGNPERVTVKPEQATAEKVTQGVYFVAKKDKVALLSHLLTETVSPTVLVFSRTKHGADKIVKKLGKVGVKGAAIHGNKSQNARQKALKNFKEGVITVLVATDIAARGIDVHELGLVINFDLPNVPETYVHRIGRTGRAKASGIALSFCDGEERAYLKDIEKLIRQKVPVIEENPFVDDTPVIAAPSKSGAKKSNNRGRNSRRRR